MAKPRPYTDRNGTVLPIGAALDIGEDEANRNAAVGDPDITFLVPSDAITMNIFSSVDAKFRFDSAPTATIGQDFLAGLITGIPCQGRTDCRIQHQDGATNLGIVSVSFETGTE